ncbi:MAG TPA: Clp protease N-terminal domain-containing protein [Aggregatilineaceae bacterium]|jgi:ATP-dependent Clp protease ATP-binding subunit ClpC|nr:Clp protease N-terminal domain-containing protein [Aggregatilineaceae bacterium]
MGENNRLSQYARRALNQAHLLAQDCRHEVVDTDHLLAGILREKGSLGSRVLADLDADTCRTEAEVRVLHPVIDLPALTLDLTDDARRVLLIAAEVSHWFGHHHIGTEHLLLALVRSREGGVQSLLRALALSPDEIRRRVRRLLRGGVTDLSMEAAKRTARLSELSRRVLTAAEQLASQRGGCPIAPDHLLLVLAHERRSAASRILRDCGLDPAALEAGLDQRVSSYLVSPEALVEEVIDHAVERANRLGTHYTGTEHLLLALAENPYGARLLGLYGVDVERLVAAVYRDLLPSG